MHIHPLFKECKLCDMLVVLRWLMDRGHWLKRLTGCNSLLDIEVKGPWVQSQGENTCYYNVAHLKTHLETWSCRFSWVKSRSKQGTHKIINKFQVFFHFIWSRYWTFKTAGFIIFFLQRLACFQDEWDYLF